MMEYDLSILTDKQREVWQLRQSGLPFKEIGERLKITPNAASTHMRSAERRFRQWEKYQLEEERNNEPISLCLTRGENKLLIDALHSHERSMLKDAHYAAHSDWKSRLPYEAGFIPGLFQKLQEAIHAEKTLDSLLEAIAEEEHEVKNAQTTDNIVPFPHK